MGLMAARLVECGFTGEKDAPAAIYGKVLGDGFDPGKAADREWILAQGYFKLHPTGRYVHSAIDALEDLLSRSGPLDPARIERIDVKAYRLAAMLKEQRVTSSFGARFSVPFALATILFHGHSGLAAFEQPAVDNPAIQALAARVHVEEDESYTARYPAEQVCDVRIVTTGKALEGRCTVTKGEISRPHSAEELRAKFLQLGAPLWSEPVARRLLDGCLRLEELPDFSRFAEGFDL
jgi:2-methylcitrate dehydratase PrpD